MKDRFAFEGTVKQFNQMLEQGVLVQYVLGHRHNLLAAVALGGAFLLLGVYAFSCSAGLVGTLCLLLGCVIGTLLIWMEQTGWKVKRELAKLKKADPPEEARRVVRIEVQDECLRVLAAGAEVPDSAYSLETLRSAGETEQAFLLNFKDGNGYVLSKAAIQEGTPDEFREYLQARTKKYRFYQFTEKIQSFIK